METLRQATDEALGIRRGQGAPHFLLGGIGLGDEKVVGRGAVEEEALLCDHGDGASQFSERN